MYFTDIERSTLLLHRLGDAPYQRPAPPTPSLATIRALGPETDFGVSTDAHLGWVRGCCVAVAFGP
jgi:hypothetical protein